MHIYACISGGESCDMDNQTIRDGGNPKQLIVANSIFKSLQEEEHKHKSRNTRFEGGGGENLNKLRRAIQEFTMDSL